jgi:glycosyltransferase involved in cell wall biosynthesis
VSVYWTGDEVVAPGERELLKAVDLVFAISPDAVERTRIVGGDKVVLMPMAIDPQPFISARAGSAVPPELRGLQRPILGYGGGISSKRMDWEKLRAVASTTAGTVVLVGPAMDGHTLEALRRLEALSNVRWIGHRDSRDAPAYLASFDVGLIPYRTSAFNLGSNPVKFYEYLAAGLPVVSADLPALWPHRDLAVFADDPRLFARAVEEMSHESKRLPGLVAERQARALGHDYSALIDRIDDQVAEVRTALVGARMSKSMPK